MRTQRDRGEAKVEVARAHRARAVGMVASTVTAEEEVQQLSRREVNLRWIADHPHELDQEAALTPNIDAKA